MYMKKEAQIAEKEADQIVELSIEEARELPGLLGRIVPACLELRGWYAAIVDGSKIYYKPKGI